MNKNKKRIIGVILITGVILIGVAVWLYYQQETSDNKTGQTASTTTTETEVATESQGATTNETANVTKNESITEEPEQETSNTAEKKQNKKLPDNYEWDEKRWGEPPQIVYDFAEHKEKFDFIVSEVDSMVTDEEGFTTKKSMNGLYYNSKRKNIDNKLSDEFKRNAIYLFENTKFYQITKTVGGHWFMYYDQEEDTDIYIYYMAYAPEMTEEEAWDNGYMKVVGDWYFATVWKV